LSRASGSDAAPVASDTIGVIKTVTLQAVQSDAAIIDAIDALFRWLKEQSATSNPLLYYRICESFSTECTRLGEGSRSLAIMTALAKHCKVGATTAAAAADTATAGTLNTLATAAGLQQGVCCLLAADWVAAEGHVVDFTVALLRLRRKGKDAECVMHRGPGMEAPTLP